MEINFKNTAEYNMNKFSSLSSWLLLSASAALIGCGGGGGGGSNPPPAVSSAPASVSSSSSSSSISSSSSAPANTQLTIQGNAAAKALAGGEVVFTIGSKTYKASIDNALKYSIALDVPAQDINAPFVAVATGSAGDSWVQLARLYPSVKALVEKAGSDKVLNEEEYSDVTITPLSTAEYAEIKNKQFPFATDEERTSALFSLHPIRALEQAAMVERLLTDIDVDLPAQTKTTLDYLLNANLAETHLEVLRVNSDSTLSDYVEQIQNDSSQANVSAKKIEGSYFLAALNSTYFLTFNADGTGTLVTGAINANINRYGIRKKVTAAFTWLRKEGVINLTFDGLAESTQDTIQAANGNYYGCDDWSTSEIFESCRVQYDEMQLDLITENENYYLGNLKLSVTLTKEIDGSFVYEGEIKPQLTRVTPVGNFVAINRAELTQAELVGENYSYIFNLDGTVKEKDLLKQTEVVLNWSLENNRVLVGDSQLWISHKTQGGYGIYYVSENSVSLTSLFKRSSVVMSESDWIGRWSSFPKEAYGTGSLYDVNEDKTWRDGFEAQSAGSWAVIDGHNQTAVSNGSWRMDRDLVSIQGDKYYLSTCQGRDETPFVRGSCYLDIQQKSVNFDTAIFWKNWSAPAFNEKVTGEPLLGLWGNLLSYENINYSYVNYSGLTNKNYVPVSSNKFYSETLQTILEMTSASRNEIELCEYHVNETCTEADKLTYERGIEVKLTVGAGGMLTNELEFFHYGFGGYVSSLNWQLDKVFMVPKSWTQTVNIVPDVGYSLDSITGCNGELSGNKFRIPALVATCEISVSFKKN